MSTRLVLAPEQHPLEIAGLRLYQAARDLGTWNARQDLDWEKPTSLTGERAELAWGLASQAVYAEQLGLGNAAALISAIDDLDTRMCLAVQCADEAKHSEVFARYALRAGCSLEPPLAGVTTMESMVEQLPNPMERFLVHTFLEGVALDEFFLIREAFKDDLLHDIYGFVIKDEARHVAMGLEHLERLIDRDAWPTALADLERYRETAVALCGIDTRAMSWLANLSGRRERDVVAWFTSRHNRRIDHLIEGSSLGRR
ncbi:MAG: ferritin-like domain-containing protein [Frankiaceae bacterium]